MATSYNHSKRIKKTFDAREEIKKIEESNSFSGIVFWISPMTVRTHKCSGFVQKKGAERPQEADYSPCLRTAVKKAGCTSQSLPVQTKGMIGNVKNALHGT